MQEPLSRGGEETLGEEKGRRGRGEDEEEEKEEEKEERRRRGGGPELPRPAELRERQDSQPPLLDLPAPPTPSAGTWGCRCARGREEFSRPEQLQKPGAETQPEQRLDPSSRGSRSRVLPALRPSVRRSVGRGSCKEASCSLSSKPTADLQLFIYLGGVGCGETVSPLHLSPPPICTQHLPLKSRGIRGGRGRGSEWDLRSPHGGAMAEESAELPRELSGRSRARGVPCLCAPRPRRAAHPGRGPSGPAESRAPARSAVRLVTRGDRKFAPV